MSYFKVSAIESITGSMAIIKSECIILVKRSDCGFLAGRNVRNREHEEVEKNFREYRAPTVTLIQDAQSSGFPTIRHEPEPLCFMQTYDLKKEYTNQHIASIANVLHQDRECGSFTE